MVMLAPVVVACMLPCLCHNFGYTTATGVLEGAGCAMLARSTLFGYRRDLQPWENCKGQDGGCGSPEEHMGIVSKLGECVPVALIPQVSVYRGLRQGREMACTSCFVL